MKNDFERQSQKEVELSTNDQRIFDNAYEELSRESLENLNLMKSRLREKIETYEKLVAEKETELENAIRDKDAIEKIEKLLLELQYKKQNQRDVVINLMALDKVLVEKSAQ